MTPQQQLQWLRSPGRCLPALAEVHDQETGTFVKYNPYRLTHSLQREVLEYIDNPPLTEYGQTKWLTIVASRQVGKSLIAEYGLYPKVAYTPGWDHICIADTDARANYLHKRVHFMHQRWPEDVRSPTLNLKEVRQLTFDSEIGGKMRILSAETGAVGIGQSPDSFHACLSRGTLVVNKIGGVVPIENISVGDTIITHTGVGAKVSYKSSKVKPCIGIKVHGMPDTIMVTEEHKFYTKDGMMELKDILLFGAMVGHPISKISGKYTSAKFVIPLSIRAQGGGRREKAVPNSIGLDYNSGRLIGLYIAEGTIVKQAKAPHGYSAVQFALHDKEVETVVDWLKPFEDYYNSLSIRANKNSKTRVVVVYGKAFATFFSRLCGMVDGKHMPYCWRETTDEFVRGVIHGYILGDGHGNADRYNRRISVSSVRPATIIGLRDMVAALGYGWGTIARRDAGYYYGRNCREIWTFNLYSDGALKLADEVGWSLAEYKRGHSVSYTISDGYVWLQVEQTSDPVNMEVYDLEIDHPDHSYCLIGVAVSNSECAFWSDFATSMMLVYPSMINRNHCLAIFECTPWRAGDDWHEHVLMAKRRQGRNEYLFKPFWDGKLNVRPWASTDSPSQEELKLLGLYGHLGLTMDNLAFRRFILESDAEIRRHPEMFKTFYPFDDVSCWVTSALSAIPGHALEKHQNMGLVDVDRAYVEHIPPDRDSVYVIGVDPCGHAARDHAAFQVIEVCDGVWRQVAWYAAHTDPVEFTRKLFDVGIHYNKAMLYVENNGVGQGVLALLREWAYPRIFFGKSGQPGFASTSQSLDQMTAWLIDGLMDELRLYDKQTVEQLMSYRHDKRVEEAPVTEIIRGNPSKRRRERHHWDRVSALMFAIVGARRTATRYKQPRELPAGENPIHSGIFKASDRKKEWEEIQRQRRLRDSFDPWYRTG